MNSAIADRLIEINRRFYTERGRDFSATRRQLRPGVRRILASLAGDETLLDLGCGNGSVASELSRIGHTGRYLGADFSGPLLEDACRHSLGFPAQFVEADLLALNPNAGCGTEGADSSPAHVSPLDATDWSVITAFAFLHHVPGCERRLKLLQRVRAWLKPEGRFLHSNWQFSTNPRMRSRILAWSAVNLDEGDLDQGDYLIEWRRGGFGVRYVHEFREAELAELAAATGFSVGGTFYADGADRRSGLYQTWEAA